MVTDSNSVHKQITHLCEKILKSSNHVDQHNSDIIIKDLRSISFAILLNKSYKSRVYNVDEELDAASKILAHSYKLYQWNLSIQATKLYQLIDGLQNCDWGSNPVIESVLVFLATLANEVPNDEEVLLSKIQPFHIPSGSKIKPYLEFTPQVFEPPCLLNLQIKKSFPFNREPGTGLMLLNKKRLSSTTVKWCFEEEINFTELKKPRNLKIPRVLSFSEHQFKDEGYGSPSQDPSLTMSCRLDVVDSEVWEMVLDSGSDVVQTWESLGSISSSREKPYLTEAGNDCVEKLWKSKEGIKHIRKDQRKTEKLLLVPISRLQLVRDLKFLLVGVPSQMFHYNEKEDGFVLSSRVCVDGLTPATLHAFCKEFLIAGACCLHLERLIASKSIHEGLMFQALCGSMRRYLHFYHCAVMMLPEGPFLLNVRKQFDGLFVQITCLASLCQVHPHLSVRTLPEGVALLAYLYEEIQKVTRKDVACILYSALQACCQVYFSFLQRWMFEGICRDMYSEFFIQERSDLMPCRQREYWSQGHYILAGAVPGFLHGLEEAIFHCGKALNLLKLCNPKDELCEMLQSGYPSMHCCLHSGDLQRLEIEWSSYEYRALAICGKPYSVNWHRQEDDCEFRAAVQCSQQERLRMFTQEREMELRATAAAKAKEFAALKEQVRLAEEWKAQEKQRRKEEELQELKKAKELEEETAKLLELEKADLQTQYQYLSEMADKRRMHAERQIEQMKMLLPNENDKDVNSNVSDLSEISGNKTKLKVINSEYAAQYVNQPSGDGFAERALEHDEENNLKHGTDKFDGNKVDNNDVECDEINMNTKAIDEKTVDIKTIERDKENNMAHGAMIMFDQMESCESEISSVNTRNVEKALGREVESTTTFETASNGSDIESLCCNSVVLQTNKLVSYSYPLTLGASPLVNINNSLDITNTTAGADEMDVGTIDMSSISIALQKSILLPLKIQASLVNSALLKYFLETEDLLSHLHSLRNFFFLLDGEFGRNVTSALFRCMYQAAIPSDMLNSVTLNSVLTQSITQTDPHLDRLSFDVKYIPLHFSFSSPLSLDCVMLQYRVGWPLNIILTTTALHKYNDVLSQLREYSFVRLFAPIIIRLMMGVNRRPKEYSLNCDSIYTILAIANDYGTYETFLLFVFGFLLRLRRISWVLEEDFHRLKRASKEIPALLQSPEYQRLQLYRHEMTHFIHALQTYVTASVLQASWVEFLKNLQRAKSLDDVYRMHVSYVKMVLFRCLLNKQSAAIQKALVDTLRMVLKFHGQLSAGAWQLTSGNAHYQHPKFSTLVQIYSSFHNLAAFIFKFATKLANTGYQPHLLDLLQLLNMNEFYPEHF